jgi:hypothetical protein
LRGEGDGGHDRGPLDPLVLRDVYVIEALGEGDHVTRVAVHDSQSKHAGSLIGPDRISGQSIENASQW